MSINDDIEPEWIRNYSIVYNSFLVTMLAMIGIISLFSGNTEVSEIENRKLTPFPKFTAHSLFQGEFTDSLDLFYSDNFPFRDELVQLAASIKDMGGFEDDIKYYQAGPAEIEPDLAVIDTAASIAIDTTKSPVKKDSVKAAPEYNKSASIVVYNGRAIQLFGAAGEAATKYAEMVNLYNETFPNLDIYCLVAPTPVDFYLPEEYKKRGNVEEKNIQTLGEQLDSTVYFVDAYHELQKHTEKYIYFNTDHHWTGLGAYYAYRAFCKSAGLRPFELKEFEKKKVKKKFLGSLYGVTLDKRLRETRDSVEYYRPPVEARVFRYNRDSSRFEKTRMFSNVANYANFIGGDHPIVRIENDSASGTILVIKDSFGNAVAPYLSLHFGTVWVVDYRYFEGNIPDLVKSERIDAIMFLHNTFAVNSKFTAYRGRYFLNWTPKSKEIVADSTSRQ
jgi:hypothetical protein